MTADPHPRTDRRYCRGCGYNLDRLESTRCPECGRLFDPEDRRTFDRRPGRRRVRRAVRLCLAVLAVAAVVFVGGVMWLLHDWGREQPEIEKLGGISHRVQVERTGPPWLRRALGTRYGPLLDRVSRLNLSRSTADQLAAVDLTRFRHVRDLELYDAEITNETLARVGGMTTVEKLQLNGTPITGGLDHLAGMKHLRVLALVGTQVGDRELEYLLHLPIEELYLHGTDVTDAGVRRLRDVKTLRLLFVGSNISRDVGRELMQANPGLRIVYYDDGDAGRSRNGRPFWPGWPGPPDLPRAPASTRPIGPLLPFSLPASPEDE